MKLLHESLKANLTGLQYCIQYEVLQKKPIFESYKTFCKTFGDDVMDYQEFEFWYMRFYKDQLDLDYDRREEPEPLTFSMLPVEIVDEIVEKLDAIDRIMVRQVSKGLRGIIDEKKPLFEKLSIVCCSETSVSLKLDDQYLKYEETTENSCSVSHENWMFEVENQDFVKTALRDLKGLLSYPMRPYQKLLEITEKSSLQRSYFLEKIPMDFTSQFYVNSLKIDHLDQIFESLVPGTLESIEVDNVDSFEYICKTEQWKQLKSVTLKNRYSEVESVELKHFYHLEYFSIRVYNLAKQDLVDLMDALFRSKVFQRCQILTRNIAQIRATFGENSPASITMRNELDDQVHRLEIHFRDRIIEIEKVA